MMVLKCCTQYARKSGKNIQNNYAKKDLNNPGNHNDVITHLEPDILECKVEWAFRGISTNKSSGGDGIPMSYFNNQR